MTLEEIKCEVIEEIHRAQEKFPWWPKDVVHAAAIVAEEAGELQKAALQFYYQNGGRGAIRKEALQTASMVYRLLFHIEQYWPEEPGESGKFEE